MLQFACFDYLPRYVEYRQLVATADGADHAAAFEARARLLQAQTSAASSGDGGGGGGDDGGQVQVMQPFVMAAMVTVDINGVVEYHNTEQSQPASLAPPPPPPPPPPQPSAALAPPPPAAVVAAVAPGSVMEQGLSFEPLRAPAAGGGGGLGGDPAAALDDVIAVAAAAAAAIAVAATLPKPAPPPAIGEWVRVTRAARRPAIFEQVRP